MSTPRRGPAPLRWSTAAAVVLTSGALAAAAAAQSTLPSAPTDPVDPGEPMSTPSEAPAVAGGWEEPLRLDPSTERIVGQVLAHSPRLERARRLALAAASSVEAATAWPDPVLSTTLYAASPETRVGPQRFGVSWMQRLPWFGKLELRERIAALEAAAHVAELEVVRLDLVRTTRVLLEELAFLAAQEKILGEERLALERFEQTAQARYAAGNGSPQEAVRIQAQITRLDARLLGLETRRADLLARLDALRGGGSGSMDAVAPRRSEPADLPPLDSLRELARRRAPRFEVIDARIASQRVREELSVRERRPDVSLGLAWTAVDRRDDLAPGQTVEGDGDDVVALTGSIQLPLWRGKLDAELDALQQRRWALGEERRQAALDLDAELAELVARIPLLTRQLDLFVSVLGPQAREALRAAETAYVGGGLSAVDLLDAEVVLYEVEVSVARVRADLAVAAAELDALIGRPLPASLATIQALDRPTHPSPVAQEPDHD